ncbi:MAG: hypothetical protein Kow00107_05550 [Planctomycetota bacterium]
MKVLGTPLIVVIALSATLLLSAESRCRGNSFFFDWRSYHSANTDLLWRSSESIDIEFDTENHNISLSSYLTMLSYNGYGARYARAAVLSAMKRHSASIEIDDLLAVASGSSRAPALPVVGASKETPRVLSLIAAVRLAEKPAELFDRLDPSRFSSPEAITGYLYAWSRSGRGLQPMIAELADSLSEADSIFPVLIADRDAEGMRFLQSRLSSKHGIERACALLRLSAREEAEEPDPRFSRWAARAFEPLEAGDLSLLPILACALYQYADKSALALVEPHFRSHDDLVASIAAIPVGRMADLKTLQAYLRDENIPSVAKGFLLLGASPRKEPEVLGMIHEALKSESVELRKCAALAAAAEGPAAIPKLAELFQDASYDVRACAVISAASIHSDYSYGFLKANVEDKHHQEISALASVLAAFKFGSKAARFLDCADEYTFDRERGVALLALALADPLTFAQRESEWSKSESPYLRRLIALGGISAGRSEFLLRFRDAIVEYQDYSIFGSPASLRRDILETYMPKPFSWLLDYSGR